MLLNAIFILYKTAFHKTKIKSKTLQLTKKNL